MADEIFDLLEDLFERRKKKKDRGDKSPRDRKEGPAEAAPAPKAPAFIFCSACGAKNDSGGRFCSECGEILPAQGREPQCPNCERPAPITAKFCNACGTRLLAG
jgi:membrane protease subunit (stomatin/prohibitin family)